MDSFAYNKYSNLPNYSYNCIKYLLETDEMTWKLMFYSDADAWKKPNLTLSQKQSLIYGGQKDETLFRVFSDEGQINAWVHEACVIRIWPYSIFPENRTVGTISMNFDVYAHYRVNTLSNYTTRTDTICQIIIEKFNGWNGIGALGNLFFDVMGNKENREYPSGQIPFKGKRIVMSAKVG